MNKQSKKYVVLAIFALVIVVSVVLFGMVKINYNISDYLDDSTETKISLNIIEDQFVTTGNIQVMVEGVTAEQAHSISALIKTIPNVLFVNFDDNDPNYYKDGSALFAVIVEGDEYSQSASDVLDQIKIKLDSAFEGKTNYGGAVVEKINMRNTLKSEIYIILGVALIFALVIMLIMAKSWVEPFVILFSSLMAVLINLGTNVILGEISYITNAVAAILQLALSVDYSIVLLHNFRGLKSEFEDKHDAMSKAVKVTVKPVLASALTTMVGLMALLFMTMKIGFDIGVVLTKGIIISTITALTLLPALLLVCDKFMTKFSKKDLVISGKQFCNMAFKAGKSVLVVALALIIAGGCLQAQNTYEFTDSANPNPKIIKTFGSNSTIVVVYPKQNNDWTKENELFAKLLEYKTFDGKTPVKNYTGYSNTVREEYTIAMAVEKLNIPETEVKQLFELYHVYYNDANNRKISPLTFLEYSVDLLQTDEEAAALAGPNTLRTLQTLLVINEIMTGNHTAEEMYTLVSTGVMEGTGLSEFQINQMYGLYLYDKIDNYNKENNNFVDFETMLNFIVSISDTEDGRSLMTEQDVADLAELASGLVKFRSEMEATVSLEEFKNFGRDKFGAIGLDVGIIDAICTTIFTSYNIFQGNFTNPPVSIVEILRYVRGAASLLTDNPEIYEAINNYLVVYDGLTVNRPYYTGEKEGDVDGFRDFLFKVVKALKPERLETLNPPADESFQQAYIWYFRDVKNAVPNDEIYGSDFIAFVNDAIENNPVISKSLSEASAKKLSDVVMVAEFVTDNNVYKCAEMTAKLVYLQENAQSMAGDSTLSEDAISGIYVKYVNSHLEEATAPIVAEDLLAFVVENMDTHVVLASKMTPELKEKVKERQNALVSAGALFLGETTHDRLLLSVDLPSESAESSRFVKYLMQAVNEVYGDEAHVAGHMVSTYELQETFDSDNKMISIFTIVSIFLIVMAVFKSVSLPIILVAIIQGAIWIAMSVSFMLGDPIFFMSYIIATCILMGSTIDYGILMSTNYLECRKTMDKKEALYGAVKSAMPTIFTSGLILIICGFIVGMIASLKSISTVGTLLGRGALVSVAMVTVVLPSIMYLFDGIILKLTYKGKNKETK